MHTLSAKPVDPLTAWRKRRKDEAERVPNPGFVEPAPSAEQKRRDEYAVMRAQGMTPRAAALAAGYTETQANIANRKLEPQARQTIAEMLPLVGADNAKLAEVVSDALTAEKRSRTGEMDADHGVRLGAVRLAAEISGQLKRDTSVTVAIQVNLPAGMAEDFAAFAQPSE